MNNKILFSYLDRELLKMENVLSNVVKTDIEISKEISAHIVLKPGKRFRPLLLLLSYLALNRRVNMKVVNSAAAVELLHNASLVHDDIVDLASMRRGQKTANVIWGDHASVLAGDFLLSKSLWLINKVNNFKVMNTVTNAASELANGQILDMSLSKKPNSFNLDLYYKMISLKTASLLSSCSEVGAILAGVDSSKVRKMKNFGFNLGMCFQIVDDLLDFTGSSDDLGKKPLQDLINGKITLPLIIALEKTRKKDLSKATLILKNSKFDSKNIDFLYNLILEEGAIEDSRKVLNKFTNKALNNISFLEENDYTKALRYLLEASLTRIS